MLNTERPRVTVFIPVYNREQYIGPAIESILSQSFSDFELLLVDDGSTDGSLRTMRAYPDPRIRIVCNGYNLGIPKTRNRGLQLARGEYIALLDSDDLAVANRLFLQTQYLDQNPAVVQVGGWTQAIDRRGHLLDKRKRQPIRPADIDAELLFRCCLSNTTIMARTETLKHYRYRESFPRCQDYDLHVRLAQRHRMANIPKVLSHARTHTTQITRQTPELGDEKKREIVQFQLKHLGITGSPEDLQAHLLLSRFRKTRFIPGPDYLDWADQWIQRLVAANTSSHLYPANTFSRVAVMKWARTCRAAQANIGWRAWKRFLQSPLRSKMPKLPPKILLDIWYR